MHWLHSHSTGITVLMNYFAAVHVVVSSILYILESNRLKLKFGYSIWILTVSVKDQFNTSWKFSGLTSQLDAVVLKRSQKCVNTFWQTVGCAYRCERGHFWAHPTTPISDVECGQRCNRFKTKDSETLLFSLMLNDSTIYGYSVSSL